MLEDSLVRLKPAPEAAEVGSNRKGLCPLGAGRKVCKGRDQEEDVLQTLLAHCIVSMLPALENF